MFRKMARKFLAVEKSKIEKVANRNSDVKMALMKVFGIVAVVCSHVGGG